MINCYCLCVCVCIECAAGSYGVNCESSCQCRDSSDCHPVTGQCVCSAGFTGLACQQSQSSTLLHLHLAWSHLWMNLFVDLLIYCDRNIHYMHGHKHANNRNSINRILNESCLDTDKIQYLSIYMSERLHAADSCKLIFLTFVYFYCRSITRAVDYADQYFSVWKLPCSIWFATSQIIIY